MHIAPGTATLPSPASPLMAVHPPHFLKSSCTAVAGALALPAGIWASGALQLLKVNRLGEGKEGGGDWGVGTALG